MHICIDNTRYYMTDTKQKIVFIRHLADVKKWALALKIGDGFVSRSAKAYYLFVMSTLTSINRQPEARVCSAPHALADRRPKE